MKQKHSLLPSILTFLILLLLFCPLGKGRAPFSELSTSFFRRLFQSETAREVFHLSREEAVEVFGELEKGDFV